MARALSLLLSLILALSLLPGAALAAETDNSRVYSPEEVDSVLDQVVKGGALTDAYKDYDLDGDGKLSTWDAKKMLDALPDKLAGAIRFKAMRIANGSADWVDMTIQDGKVSETTVLNEFIGTLRKLYKKSDNGFYPEAGALCDGKLMLRVSYAVGSEAASDLVPVDPDSFAAPEMNVVVGANNWHDVTALSDGRLLGVASSGNQTFFSLWKDGQQVAVGYLNGHVLVGIASAGKDNDGDEVLYGLTKDGKLYRFSLTVDRDSSLELTTTGDGTKFIPDWYSTVSNDFEYQWKIDSASLLATGGYLLAAVTYVNQINEKSSYQSKIFVIDPEKDSCVPVALPEGVVLNSLYQYEQGEKEGTQVYLKPDKTSVKAGGTITASAAAYQFSTTDRVVTNQAINVSWRSSNEKVATVDSNGVITGVAEGKATITASAEATIGGKTYTDSQSFVVNVYPNNGMKVGAMIYTEIGTVLAEIDLKATDTTEDKTFTEIDVKGKLDKSYTAGGYAQEKLWGVSNSALYSFSFDPENGYVGELVDTPKYSSDRVVDLTGAPATTIKYTTDDDTQTVTEAPAPLVYVTYSGQIGLLNGKIKIGVSSGSFVSDEDDKTIYKLSAITYVGDLTVNQVRGGTDNSSLSNCDGDTPCHVYYALAKDDDDNVSTLRQLILVPQVSADGTLTYTLCGKTIDTVAGITGSPYRMSMDFLRESDDSYGLLVAWGNGQGFNSIYYIDLAAYATNKSLKAELTGKVDSVTVDNDSKSVNSITGLYHTEDTKLSDTQIYDIAGWVRPQSLAEVTLEASLKAVSAEQSGNADAATVEVPVKASADATNGLWKLTYDSSKLELLKVAVNSDILYSDYYDDGAGTLTVGFASRTKVSSPFFLVTFTVKEGQKADTSDVTITQVELNDPKGGSGDNTGGNTGGNTGTVTPSKPETLPFTDVEEGSYCYDAVRWAVEKGVTEGVSETAFAPNDPCTRGQAVTFLWRAAGSPAPRGQEMPFTDVAESSPYAKAILWAAENGVTKGVTETTFAPNQPCTRGQIVTFLYRSQGAPAQAGSNPFTDVAEESPYLPGILWAAENGVTKGVTETTFAPNNTCVRGQIVTFLYRLWS